MAGIRTVVASSRFAVPYQNTSWQTKPATALLSPVDLAAAVAWTSDSDPIRVPQVRYSLAVVRIQYYQ